MKPAHELVRSDGATQRLYRVGNKGFSFVKKAGEDTWSAAPLIFRGPDLASLAIPANHPFGRPRNVSEDEIDAIVNNYLGEQK